MIESSARPPAARAREFTSSIRPASATIDDASAAAYAQSDISGEVHKFIDDMPAMFARADLLVCRSGASTVGEITAAGKPAIFVPFPRAADDHQNVNARALERAGAAVVVEESKLEAAYLVDTITALIDDNARLQRMSDAARSLAHPKAVEEIAAIVDELIDRTKESDGQTAATLDFSCHPERSEAIAERSRRPASRANRQCRMNLRFTIPRRTRNALC